MKNTLDFLEFTRSEAVMDKPTDRIRSNGFDRETNESIRKGGETSGKPMRM